MTTNKSAQEVIDIVGTHMFKHPFNQLLEDVTSLPEVVRDTILILEFDVELMMNGMFGYLENSTGYHFGEVTEAFLRIGAMETVRILTDIHQVMTSSGITTDRLRSGMEDLEEFQITTTTETHGEDIATIADRIEILSRQLYIYDSNREDVYGLLHKYVEPRKEEILSFLQQYGTLNLS